MKIYIVQCNMIECTDMIYVFTSMKKARAWIKEETGQDYENQNEYNLEKKRNLLKKDKR